MLDGLRILKKARHLLKQGLGTANEGHIFDQLLDSFSELEEVVLLQKNSFLRQKINLPL